MRCFHPLETLVRMDHMYLWIGTMWLGKVSRAGTDLCIMVGYLGPDFQ